MFKSKFNKIVWSINGIGILILLILALYNVIKETLPDLGIGRKPKFDRGIIVGKAAEKSEELKLDIQQLTYSRPSKIENSQYSLSEISIVDKDIPKEIKDELQRANDYPRIDATINVLFIKNDRTEVNVLLKHNAYIGIIDYPTKSFRYRYRNDDDDNLKKQKIILYNISIKDTNGDSRINSKDSSSYYISDLSGKKLKKITPDSLSLNSYWFSDDYDIIYFEDIIKGEKIRAYGLEYQIKNRKIYYYDINTGEFSIFKELQDKFSELQNNFKKSLK